MPSKTSKAESITNPSEVKQKLKYQSNTLGVHTLILSDLLSMIFALGPGVIAWGLTLFFATTYGKNFHFLISFAIAPFILIFSFLIATVVFRLFIPKMKPGIYKMGMNKGFRAWYLTLCLGHGVRIFGLQPIFFTFYITKWLYWRSMGAKIAFSTNSSLFLTIVDYPLITIEPGCSFGAYTHVACHTFLGDKLFLAPVHISKNVYIGMNTTIGPKSKIGEGSWIGFNNRVFQDKIEPNTHIENFEWEYGNPAKVKDRLKK